MVGNGYPETWIVTTHNDRNEKEACCTNFSMIFPYDVVPENILKNIRKNVCKEHFEYILSTHYVTYSLYSTKYLSAYLLYLTVCITFYCMYIRFTDLFLTTHCIF